MERYEYKDRFIITINSPKLVPGYRNVWSVEATAVDKKKGKRIPVIKGVAGHSHRAVEQAKICMEDHLNRM